MLVLGLRFRLLRGHRRHEYRHTMQHECSYSRMLAVCWRVLSRAIAYRSRLVPAASPRTRAWWSMCMHTISAGADISWPSGTHGTDHAHTYYRWCSLLPLRSGGLPRSKRHHRAAWQWHRLGEKVLRIRPQHVLATFLGYDSSLGFPGEGPGTTLSDDIGTESIPGFVLQAQWEGVHDQLLENVPGAGEEAAAWTKQMQSGKQHGQFCKQQPPPRPTARTQAICTLNCSINSSLSCMAASLVAAYRVVMIQAHRCIGTGLRNALFEYAKRGIKAHLDPALPTQKMSTRGGV
jgi:hypothetical protein